MKYAQETLRASSAIYVRTQTTTACVPLRVCVCVVPPLLHLAAGLWINLLDASCVLATCMVRRLLVKNIVEMCARRKVKQTKAAVLLCTTRPCSGPGMRKAFGRPPPH